MLVINDNHENWVSGHDEGSKVTLEFFQDSLRAEENFHVINSDEVICNAPTEQDGECLTRLVTNDIIFRTLKRIKKNKAPGLDGLGYC